MTKELLTVAVVEDALELLEQHCQQFNASDQ
jgi:hypothetical protein